MRNVKLAVFISGLAAVMGQTLIIREGLALFGGNELVSGILLCFWLVWVGLGSLVFTKLKLRQNPMTTYCLLLIMLSLSLVFSITFIRLAPKIFNLPMGEVIAFTKIIFIAMIALAPTCFVFGSLFPISVKILGPELVYLVEGIGSFVGGLLLSFVLIQFIPPYGILLLVMFLLLCSAIILLHRMVFLLMPVALLLLFIKINAIEFTFRKVEMGGQNLIALKESRYGVIAITKTDIQYNFFTNGVYDFSYPDLYASEEAVHYPLLLHETPRKVLLIGGGIGNCLTQIFEQPDVKEVTYLELDPLLFKMGEEQLGENLHDFRNLDVNFGDARFFVKNTKKCFDVVIVNLPDPVNAQINRFYTAEFFCEVRKILNRGGIFSVRIATPADIISPLYGQLLSTIDKSLHTAFENVLSLPAAKTTFIATDQKINSDEVVAILKKRMSARNLALTYVNDYFFDYNLNKEKLDYLRKRIDESRGFINTDLKPICYYFTTILWGGIISKNLQHGFIKLFGLNPFLFLLPLLLVFLFYKKRSVVYLSVFTMGASQISSEFILIILFQIFYGYVYGWIGAIIAFYMLGLALGTLCYMKSPLRRGNFINMLANIAFAVSLDFALIILVSLIRLPSANLVIPILIFIGGFLGGLHFPVSVRILQKERAGLVYGVDLIGASFGALLTAIIFVPILGIIFTLFIFLLLNILVGVGLRTVKI